MANVLAFPPGGRYGFEQNRLAQTYQIIHPVAGGLSKPLKGLADIYHSTDTQPFVPTTRLSALMIPCVTLNALRYTRDLHQSLQTPQSALVVLRDKLFSSTREPFDAQITRIYERVDAAEEHKRLYAIASAHEIDRETFGLKALLRRHGIELAETPGVIALGSSELDPESHAELLSLARTVLTDHIIQLSPLEIEEV